MNDNIKILLLESNQVHATVTDTGICTTLTASMGLGGGMIPMVIYEKPDNVDKKKD